MVGFSKLEPNVIWNAIEEAMDCTLTAYISSFTSYINRVYELETTASTRLVVKFYRPGRWSFDAICDEHDFLFDCVEAEVPVVAPLILKSGGSIGEVDGIYFAVYPKKSGRQFELTEDEDWIKVGRLLGRLHQVGSQEDATHRLLISPVDSTRADLRYLESSDVILPEFRKEFSKVIEQIIDLSIPLFKDVAFIRVHGDAHHSNFIDRLNGDILMIDFDDMVMGPSIQDFWLLLGDHVKNCRSQLNLMIRGYEEFRLFDFAELKLIEPLRAMRMIYFTGWCAMQRDDLVFQKRFPNWGNRHFWQKELDDLHRQLEFIRKN